MPYTIIDHTADFGIRVSAPDIKNLFIEAAKALLEITAASCQESSEQIPISLEGFDTEDLLIRWLQEILFWIDAKDLRVAAFEIISLSDTHFSAEISGSFSANPLSENIKAVTYHALAITQVDNHLETTIIFDT